MAGPSSTVTIGPTDRLVLYPSPAAEDYRRFAFRDPDRGYKRHQGPIRCQPLVGRPVTWSFFGRWRIYG